ncbi:MAG: ABC transporter ATP-binding protein [Chloroflexota bacterium]|nr:ABC transporter ATP-binding protein [Chloroflexota bacterium]
MIDIRNLCVTLGDFRLHNVSFTVRKGEYFVLLGPTGSGKTALLETIAGLNSVTDGQIRVDGREINSLAPERRDISIAYQDHVLFPHLSILDNITFGLRQRGKSKKAARVETAWVVDILGISHLLERRPHGLSGGERQKAALARALAIQPKVLLLDEPFGSLDPDTRERVQNELQSVHQQLGLTIIHVTHDFEEAISTSDRLAVIEQGFIAQMGTVTELFRKPNSEFVARFLMTRNIIKGEIQENKTSNAFMRIGDITVPLITDLRGEHHVCVRPEDISISSHATVSDVRAAFKGRIEHISDRGSVVYVAVSGPPEFVVLLTRREYLKMKLEKNQEVFLSFDIDTIHIF